MVTKAWVVVASGLWDDSWVCGFVKYPQFWHVASKVSVRLGGYPTVCETQ